MISIAMGKWFRTICVDWINGSVQIPFMQTDRIVQFGIFEITRIDKDFTKAKWSKLCKANKNGK